MLGMILFLICLFCAYLAVGYTSALLIEAEDDTITTIFLMAFWPVVWIVIIIFCIVYAFIEVGRNSIKK
jgi:hypothetical protein